MEIVNKTDDELLRENQTKTDTRLGERQAQLQHVENKISMGNNKTHALQQEITNLEGREAALGVVDGRAIKDVREKIGDAKWQLRVVEKAQKYLDDQRAIILRERAALNIPLIAAAFRTAPIRRMPSDVLVEIFTVLKPDEVQRPGKGPIPPLSQVCAAWRATACDHALLWSSFSCALTDPLPKTNLVDLYFHRAKTAPLTIEIKGTRGSCERSIGERILALLAAHSEQLYSLRLTGDWFSAKLYGLCGRLPCLEVLELPAMEIESSDQFAIAPRLHILILKDGSPRESLPMSQIRSLFVNRIDTVGISKFSNLTSLTCTLTYENWSSTTTHVLLLLLSCWRVDFVRGTSTPPTFFDFYTTPALETLELIALAQPAEIGAFLERSQCSLKTLVLRRSQVRIAELLKIFEHSPGLERLVMEDAHTATAITDRVLKALTASTDRIPLLPRLTHFAVRGVYMFRDVVLLEMLESRTASAAARSGGEFMGLGMVELTLGNRIVSDVHLQQLRGLEGIDISISLEYDNGDGDVDSVI